MVSSTIALSCGILKQTPKFYVTSVSPTHSKSWQVWGREETQRADLHSLPLEADVSQGSQLPALGPSPLGLVGCPAMGAPQWAQPGPPSSPVRCPPGSLQQPQHGMLQKPWVLMESENERGKSQSFQQTPKLNTDTGSAGAVSTSPDRNFLSFA